ncbi:MAG TPA: hypothetical protein VG815_19350 [Chloroflexota bacterium]|nr:hypothetical protein [Chloroflexota bacterium]
MSLTRADLLAMLELAHHYETVVGVTRHLVVATSPRAIRRKYRFIVIESLALEAEAADQLAKLDESGHDEITLELSVHDVVAFWGRVLSNLRTKRSLRKLSSRQVAVREELEGKLATAMREFWARDEVESRRAINTRRMREVPWMLEALGADQRTST